MAIIRIILDYFFLSNGSVLAAKVISSRWFPWGLWGLKIIPPFSIRGPIVLEGCSGSKIGKGFSCQGGLLISGPVEIGSDVSINYGVFLSAGPKGHIVIGNDTLVGPNVIVRSDNHIYSQKEVPIRKQGHSGGKTSIGNDVWLGAAVAVISGVSIGDGSVIGANSVVSRDIPPYQVAVGIPAVSIKARGSISSNEQDPERRD